MPRNIGRFINLSYSPLSKHDKDMRKLFKGAGPEGYQRELRKLFMDAHIHHRAFKAKRLEKKVTEELKEDIANVVSTVL